LNGLNKLLIEALKDQRDIFGDDLYEQINLTKPVTYNRDIETELIVAEKKPTPKVEKKSVKAEPQADFTNACSLDELNGLINGCMKCSLGETRTKFVFGVGNPNTKALIIGEAPGADEDKQGEPFVGRAGKLLNDILKAIKFEREDVYIANILKCRPPGNRDPQPSEMETCMPYLMKQIELIQPKVILCLGRVAGNGLLNKKLTLGDLRKEVYDWNGIKVMVTYHPAALLRNPNWKRGCWEDVQKFKKLHDELTGTN
jgi:DNA polymerase